MKKFQRSLSTIEQEQQYADRVFEEAIKSKNPKRITDAMERIINLIKKERNIK